MSPRFLPTGISQVPFRCQWHTEERAMEFLGGFVGVTQDTASLALRPKLGWAVRQASAFDQLLSQVTRFDPAPALDGPQFDECIEKVAPGWCELPGDFLRFYKSCNGVRLTRGGAGKIQFLPLESMERVENLLTQRPADYPSYFASWDVGPWVRFCNLSDGTFVALELRHTHQKGWKIIRVGTADATHTGIHPIIAWSFQEFLEQILAREGQQDFPDVGSRCIPAEE